MLNGKLIADKDSIIYDAKKGNFSPENLTLCIKMLTENDTGIYKTNYFSNSMSSTDAYHLIIQGMLKAELCFSLHASFKLVFV